MSDGSKRDDSERQTVSARSASPEGVHLTPGWRGWLRRDIFGYFLLGCLVPVPTIATATGAAVLFFSLTGVQGVSLSVPALIVSYFGPLYIHHVSFNWRMLVNVALGLLALGLCTAGSNLAGPVVGTALAGASYAWGSNTYLGAAPFFDVRCVVVYCAGLSTSSVATSGIYIGLNKALHDDWRNVLRCFLLAPLLQLLVWFFFLPRAPRLEAEEARKRINHNMQNLQDSSDGGFDRGRTRTKVFWTYVFPRFIAPLSIMVICGITVQQGLAPTFQILGTFPDAVSGSLNYQLNSFLFNAGSVTFALTALFLPIPHLWVLSLISFIILSLSIGQMFLPGRFLTHFGAWLFFVFLSGGFVGGGSANTNRKLARALEKNGEKEDVRVFALASADAMGNSIGNLVGGAFAVMIQQLAIKHLLT